MGIVDDETRRIYETALTSKRIDLNPSIRRYVFYYILEISVRWYSIKGKIKRGIGVQEEIIAEIVEVRAKIEVVKDKLRILKNKIKVKGSKKK